jgi:hypothetical protein
MPPWQLYSSPFVVFLWWNNGKHENAVGNPICKEVVYIYTLRFNTYADLFDTGSDGHRATNA